MQTTSLTRSIGAALGAALFTVGLIATVPHIDAAQGGPGGRGGRMGGPIGGRGFGDLAQDLSDAQREQVKAIRERHADRIRPLVERSREAREALNAAVFGGNTGNLQGLSIDIGNAETELAFAQAQVQAEIFGVLTAEQKQRMPERRKEIEQRRGDMMKRRQNRAP